MKVLMTGGRGRVGTYLQEQDASFVPADCDVRDKFKFLKVVRQQEPDIILHLAAQSNVDFCEDEKNRSTVIETNVRGTFNVAEVAETVGCKMVMMSSGYVFSGKLLLGKYKESHQPSSVKIPNFYGLSKLSAESFAKDFGFKIIRTSYLFDAKCLQGIRSEYEEALTQSFPTFLIRSFLYLPHFTKLIQQYCARFDEMPSILHLAGKDAVSWHKFVEDWFYYAGWDVNKVLPRRYEEEGHAPRGKNLGLETYRSELLGFHPYSYLDGIREMVSE